MQLTFKDVEIQEKQARIKALANELDRKLKSVALQIDRNDLAALNDRSYSYISEMLNTNNETGQKPWQVRYIPSLCIENPDTFNFSCQEVPNPISNRLGMNWLFILLDNPKYILVS